MQDEEKPTKPSRRTDWRALLCWGVVFVLILTGAFLLCESYLRYRIFKKYAACANSDITKLVVYSAVIDRAPYKKISFRFLNDLGVIQYRADIKLNNHGYYSIYDYKIEKEPNEFRIVTIGGEQTATTVADVSWPDYLQQELNEHKRPNDPHVYNVVNIAIPDAGPLHYQGMWEEGGKQYQPDLVIINMCETDFYRTVNFLSIPPTFQGKRIDKTEIQARFTVPHANGEYASVNLVAFPGYKAAELGDPNILFGRPVPVKVSEDLIANDRALLEIQRYVVDELIRGSLPGFGGMTYRLLTGQNVDINPHLVRNFDPAPSQPIDIDAMVRSGAKSFYELQNTIPHSFIIHNFSYPELIQKIDYAFTKQMIGLNPQIKLIDMRERLSKAPDPKETEKLYLIPGMGEKWSDAGHRFYAALVRDLVFELLDKDGGDVTKLRGIIRPGSKTDNASNN